VTLPAPRSPGISPTGPIDALGALGAFGAFEAVGVIRVIGALGVIGLGLACGRGGHGGPAAPANAARAGVSIALYAHQGGGAYGVVDDRRWIEVAGEALVLDHVDPGAALSSLVIEPVAGGALEIGACLRDRIPDPPPDADPVPGAARGFAPVLRCAVRAGRGRYLVRVLYVSPALGYRAQHDLAMTAPDRARVTSRFAIATPAWQARAEVTLFDGMPGTEAPPREVARGTIMLDGGVAVVAVPPREVAAQLRWIYRGAVRGDGDGEAGRDPQPAVWVWLELADPPIRRSRPARCARTSRSPERRRATSTCRPPAGGRPRRRCACRCGSTMRCAASAIAGAARRTARP
jgi:hypothetical protein